MSPLQTLERELKKMETHSKGENPFFLKLMQWIPPHPIASVKEHALFLGILKKISVFMNEVDADSSIRRIARFKEQVEGYAQYARVIEEFILHYERDRFRAPRSSAREMLAFFMEQQGLSQLDIAKDLGGQPNVSAVLAGRRELNLRQIRRLAARFHVSPLAFIPA